MWRSEMNDTSIVMMLNLRRSAASIDGSSVLAFTRSMTVT